MVFRWMSRVSYLRFWKSVGTAQGAARAFDGLPTGPQLDSTGAYPAQARTRRRSTFSRALVGPLRAREPGDLREHGERVSGQNSLKYAEK